MKNTLINLKNAFMLFIWALMNPTVFREHNFVMMSDLMKLIISVSKEQRPRMTQIAYISPIDSKEHIMCSIWVGAGAAADPYDRIMELRKEIYALNDLLEQEKLRNKETSKSGT